MRSGTLVTVTADRGWARLNGRDNALNFLRLVLAALVVLGHGYLIGYGTEPPVREIHSYAVDGFFVISGFLIAASRSRTPVRDFLVRRVLRLVPGLVACLVLCAVVLGPLVARAVGQEWSGGDSVAYLLRNGSFQMRPGVNTATFTWNLSLWTLPFEAACYAMLGVLFSVARDRLPLVAGVAVASWTLTMWDPWPGSFVGLHGPRLVGFFTAGALVYLLSNRIPFSGMIAAASSIVVVLLGAAGLRWYWAVGPVFLSYALLWLGSTLPIRACQRSDLSYGTYVYGMPLQQVLLAFGLHLTVPPWEFFVLTMAVVLPTAWASWRLIERPAARLGRNRSVQFEPQPRHMGERAIADLPPRPAGTEGANAAHMEPPRPSVAILKRLVVAPAKVAAGRRARLDAMP